jgi:hypothetical protein
MRWRRRRATRSAMTSGCLAEIAGLSDRPVSEILQNGPTLPMTIAFFRNANMLSLCKVVGFDPSFVDSSGRYIAHFAAAGGSNDAFTVLTGACRRSGPKCSMRQDRARELRRIDGPCRCAEGASRIVFASRPAGRPGHRRAANNSELALSGAIGVLLRHESPVSSDRRAIRAFRSALHQARPGDHLLGCHDSPPRAQARAASGRPSSETSMRINELGRILQGSGLCAIGPYESPRELPRQVPSAVCERAPPLPDFTLSCRLRGDGVGN